MRAPIELRMHDTHIGIWQASAHDPSFRDEVYGGLIRLMRARGWTIGQDPHTRRHYACLSPNHRLGRKGDLRCSIQLAGRSITVEVWAETWPLVHSNGHRYDFDKLQRMTYLDRLRFLLERRHIAAWLRTIAPVTGAEPPRKPLPPMDTIAREYRTSWHKDKAIGRPVCTDDRNRTSADGALLEHGQTVWMRDRSGRWIRGQAFYRINNVWFMVAGSDLHYPGCFQLYAKAPADPREKRNARLARERLEAEHRKAVANHRYRRAEILHRLICEGTAVWRIWSRKNDAWYRTGCAGYTTDRSTAGLYTRAEAEAEVRRVPHNLEAHGPDGAVFRVEAARHAEAEHAA
ncbi:hypothetical protein [Phreatobacter oligotrophus]|uniref:Uncharacterized protein n=1 Tax=Phreatobacter oligotrophus TaxID=1122261 RepID=A0A2T4ZIR9_9HYPH|nr:hypothetical protein [Phreatobacter oligotrophus]PTM61876.1 hypothetical protein C8P69_101548 [Phreatobacter oligotrophus]